MAAGAAMAVSVIAGATGCGPASTAKGGTGAATSLSSAGATSPASTPLATSATSAGPLTSPPAGGRVPAGFAADSVTFVSPQEGFVLGTAPCATAPCTLILRTRDRGATWTSMPAPAIPVGRLGTGPSPQVWGIRFATPEHGFVFGKGLWETTDGGEHWAPASHPGTWIVSLATIDGQVLAVTNPQVASGHAAIGDALVRRPLGGGSWQPVAPVPGNLGMDAIATQAGVATVAYGSTIMVSSNGGITLSSHPAPCRRPGFQAALAGATPTPRGLAVLCTGESGQDPEHGTVTQYAAFYTSADLGAHWSAAGTPPHGPDYGSVAITASASGALVIGTSGGPVSWLIRSGDGAATWAAVATSASVAGPSWVDLGFTTPADGAAIYGPVDLIANPRGPGQLFLTEDGGATWHQARF